MKSTIFIPEKINIGYQKRSNTYTQKLAYIIYFDEKGVLRKETSWQNWRDKELGNDIFENVPTEGFVLNKKVGDYVSCWNHRQAYVRVYDPRGFEFEVTIENLLFILENATSSKGKGLEGEFVYGWSGKDLVLLPVESADYKSILEYSEKIHSRFKIGARTIKVGATYLTKNNEQWIYMGRYDHYEYSWSLKVKLPNGEDYYTYNKEDKKKFFFVSKKDDGTYSCHVEGGNWQKFIAEIEDNTHDEYAEMYAYLEKQRAFSPVNISATQYIPFTYEEFDEYVRKELNLEDHDNRRWSSWRTADVNTNVTGYLHQIEVKVTNEENPKPYINFKYKKQEEYRPSWSWTSQVQLREVEYEETVKFDNFRHLFDVYKPMYQVLYLENGQKFKEDK